MYALPAVARYTAVPAATARRAMMTGCQCLPRPALLTYVCRQSPLVYLQSRWSRWCTTRWHSPGAVAAGDDGHTQLNAGRARCTIGLSLHGVAAASLAASPALYAELKAGGSPSGHVLGSNFHHHASGDCPSASFHKYGVIEGGCRGARHRSNDCIVRRC
jgi:hypothetical protein